MIYLIEIGVGCFCIECSKEVFVMDFKCCVWCVEWFVIYFED